MIASRPSSVRVRRVLRAATPPRSPRALHVAVITRCLVALLFASGCVSRPAYEQVSSAAEVEREAHRRTHAELVLKEAKLKELEEATASGSAEPPAPAAGGTLTCPETRDQELGATLKAREAELLAVKKRNSELERQKTALARAVGEKEAELRQVRERDAAEETSRDPSKVARDAGEKEPDGSASKSDADREPFVIDQNVPDPLPAEPTSISP